MKNPVVRPPRPSGRYQLRIACLPPVSMPVRILTMEERRSQRDNLTAVISGIERQTAKWRNQPALMLQPLLPTRMERELPLSVDRIVIEDAPEDKF